jgi:uncharacterized protein YkwD
VTNFLRLRLRIGPLVFAIAASALVSSALFLPSAVYAEAATVDTSGFAQMNADGSYGPYATFDQPVLADQGNYVQAGERWESYLDQYGNGYWLDLGASIEPQASPTFVPTRTAVPTAAVQPTAQPAVSGQPERPAGWELPIMLGKVNEERVSRGLRPLIEDPALDAAAQQYADYEAETGCYGHNCGEEPFHDRATALMKAGHYRHIGEDLHLFRDDPLQVVDADYPHIGWMQSPGHRDLILNPDMTRVGAGIASARKPIHSGPEVGSTVRLDNAQPWPGERFWVLDEAG